MTLAHAVALSFAIVTGVWFLAAAVRGVSSGRYCICRRICGIEAWLITASVALLALTCVAITGMG